jgi:hypothetical protein
MARSFWQGVARHVLPGRSRPRRATGRPRLALESLEARTVPAILFGNNLGRVPEDLGGPVINTAHVELIFWGNGWNSGVGPALRGQVQDAVDGIVSGPYLTLLAQYRSSIRSGTRAGSVTITSSAPPNPFSNAAVVSFLQVNISNGTLPHPGTDSQLLYMVIPQPGTSAGNIGGEHNSAVNSGTRFHYGWTINNSNLGTITTIFSHELAEAVSDPEVNVHTAIVVPSTNDELGDGDAQSFTYRLNGVLVQSLLSERDRAYAVATGQAQNFLVSANRVLTVNGDQLADHNDVITVDLVNNGVTVTLNGETAQFPAGAIAAVVINTGTGDDTVVIERTGPPVTVNLGNGTDTADIAPGTQNLNNVLGNVTVTGLTAADTLTVNDQANATVRHYTLTATTFTRAGGGVITYNPAPGNLVINGGAGADTYQVTGTAGATATTLNAGNGGNSVRVQGSAGPLTINTGAGDTVTLGGASNTLDPIGAVAVNDPTGTGAVVVDDSGFGPAEDYLVSSTGVTVSRSGSFGLTYRGIASLTLDGGRGGDTFDLDSTSAFTAVNGGPGFNCFHVSPLTQYLAGSLAGPLALNGSGSDVLDFFDANDPNAEIFSFDSVPSSLTLGSTGATVATFTGMGSVYVVTNGFSTPDDQSGTVVFDPDGGPPCVSACGPGSSASTAGIPATPPPGAVLPPPPNPVETRWTRATAVPLDVGQAFQPDRQAGQPDLPVAAPDLVFNDLG